MPENYIAFWYMGQQGPYCEVSRPGPVVSRAQLRGNMYRQTEILTLVSNRADHFRLFFSLFPRQDGPGSVFYPRHALQVNLANFLMKMSLNVSKILPISAATAT